MASHTDDMTESQEGASVLILENIVRPGNFIKLSDAAIISTHAQNHPTSGAFLEDDITSSLRRMVPQDEADATRQAGMDVSSGVRSIIKDELNNWIRANVPLLIREVLEEEGLELRQQLNQAPQPKKSSNRGHAAKNSKPKKKATKRQNKSSTAKRVAKKGRPTKEKNSSL